MILGFATHRVDSKNARSLLFVTEKTKPAPELEEFAIDSGFLVKCGSMEMIISRKYEEIKRLGQEEIGVMYEN